MSEVKLVNSLWYQTLVLFSYLLTLLTLFLSPPFPPSHDLSPTAPSSSLRIPCDCNACVFVLWSCMLASLEIWAGFQDRELPGGGELKRNAIPITIPFSLRGDVHYMTKSMWTLAR